VKILLALVLSLMAPGCAMEVVRHESALSPVNAATRLTLASPVQIRLDSGYSRSIAAGTEFAVAGTLAEGRVLKPTRSIFTIEGAHMHEAYPVERAGRLVGFYLPVEKSFSPLSSHVDLPLQGDPTK
jgi:hypothetical protein